MKKFLLCGCIALLMLPVATLFGADLSLKAERNRALEMVEITLFVVEAPGMRACQFVVTYDAGALTYRGFRLGEMASGALHAVNDKEAGTVRVAMAAREPMEGDGNLAVLLFTGIGELHVTDIRVDGEKLPDVTARIDKRIGTKDGPVVFKAVRGRNGFDGGDL